MTESLVSIIMPVYNAEQYLEQSINSVLSQTYKLWELIVVDDCSTDSSYVIAQNLAKTDSRIKVYQTQKASGGPTEPRNLAIDKAQGKYIAFLDSDDLWLPKKLEEQLPLFKDKETKIVFSYYRKIYHNNKISKGVVKAPSHVDYEQLLNGNLIGNLTGIYDVSKVGKQYLINVGHEDYVHWLHILKPGGYATCTNEVHAIYRITENSISRNKFKAFRWDWNIFYNIEKLSLIKSCKCFVLYAIKGVIKTMI